jgi:hypothetical protein
MSGVWSNHLTGFLSTRNFLVVPKSPRRATVAALGLSDAVEPRQRIMFRAAAFAALLGLGRVLPGVARLPAGLNPAWWRDWFEAVARPMLGDASYVGYRVPPNGRVAALLMDHRGKPLAFAKQLSRPPSDLELQISRALQHGGAPFNTPQVIAEGEFNSIWYRMYAPLPSGLHRRPPHDPPRLRAILDAWHQSLHHLPRPPGASEDAVVCHADFTPRNLRVASDGRWWLIDWDNARWGPKLADELHYWCAEYCWGLRPRPQQDARRVVALLRQRGTDADITTAADWPEAPARAYRPAELKLRARVGELARFGQD